MDPHWQHEPEDVHALHRLLPRFQSVARGIRTAVRAQVALSNQRRLDREAEGRTYRFVRTPQALRPNEVEEQHARSLCEEAGRRIQRSLCPSMTSHRPEETPSLRRLRRLPLEQNDRPRQFRIEMAVAKTSRSVHRSRSPHHRRDQSCSKRRCSISQRQEPRAPSSR